MQWELSLPRGEKFDVGAGFENHAHSSVATLMGPPTRTKKTPRTDGERATQTESNADDWLVHCLAFSIRIFLILFVAFARAVVLVAGDSIPDNLFDQHLPVAVPIDSSSSTQCSNSCMDPLKSPQPSVTDSELPPACYVIFVGRDIGYTSSSTLMTRLVHGIPNNYSRKFKTFDEAVRAYSESVLHGNVRRVRTVINSSGYVEFIYDYIGMTEGIRNLDEPHLPPHPLVSVNAPPMPSPPTPCNSETCADLTSGTTESSVSSASSALESNGLVMPVGWSVANSQEARADTVIISAATALALPQNERSGVPGALTVIILDSDEDSSTASVFENNSASTHSAHSSDIYYTDKAYDRAFAAYIEEEEEANNGTATNAGSSGDTVLVD